MSVVVATLVKLETDDGLVSFKDDVQLGKTYLVELNTKRVERMFNTEHGIWHEKEVIGTYPFRGWLPTEVLKLGGAP